MQEKLKSSKSQSASTLAKIQHMQNIPYALAVGSIMYDVRYTRPDVAFTQNITSRFQQNPGDAYWTTVKNILKYLRNTKDMFLVYGVSSMRILSHKANTLPIISISASLLLRLPSGSCWNMVVRSDLKVGERVWVCMLGRDGIWELMELADDGVGGLDDDEEFCRLMKYSFIQLFGFEIILGSIGANDYGVTKGARHFRAKVYYLRETIEMGDVRIEKIDTDDNLADPFTKALAFPKPSELTRKIGLMPASSLM
nr:hypothetical protein [Tanacetum cinerariifolium]